MKKIGIINVGASAFRMYITEYDPNGDEHGLDYLVKPLRLGTDTFTQGYISLENVKRATDILNMFRLKLEEYNITEYKAMCTSGVREATNREFFLDYTMLHSDIKLEILDPSEEIYIKYLGAKHTVEDFKLLEKEGLVFANVSSGNVMLNISRKDLTVYAGSLPYGSLRLRQMFRSISHLKRHKAIEEHVRVMISRIISTIDPKIKLRHLLGSGSSINLMLRLFNETVISLNRLKEVYELVRTMSLIEIEQETGLRKDEASVLVPTLITYINLLDIVGSKSFTFSNLSFPHTMALYYSGQIKDRQVDSRIGRTLISIAEKYRANTRHAKWVLKFATKMFNELDDLHSLGQDSLNILEAAVILNDVGYYVADDNLAGNSLYIIKSLKIPGADPNLLRLAASVVYEGNRVAGQRDPQEYAYLSPVEVLNIRKLAAILRLAKALDYSHNRHIYELEIAIADHVIIYAHAEKEPYLEMYAFDQQKQLFIETFGVSIDLRARVNYD